MAAAGVVLLHLYIVCAGVCKISQMAFGFGQTPIHIRIVGIKNQRGLKARQGAFPILVLEIIPADVFIFGCGLMVLRNDLLFFPFSPSGMSGVIVRRSQITYSAKALTRNSVAWLCGG